MSENEMDGPAGVPDMNAWIAEVKALPDADGIGMMLVHRGIVRGTTRAGAPVSRMMLTYDADRLDEVLAEARSWPGVIAVRAWINSGMLVVGDDIMAVLVAGDIRDNVIAALQKLVGIIKTEVVAEDEIA